MALLGDAQDSPALSDQTVAVSIIIPQAEVTWRFSIPTECREQKLEVGLTEIQETSRACSIWNVQEAMNNKCREF